MSTEKHYIVFKQAYYLLTVCTKVDILMSCIKIGENGKEGDEQQGKRKAVLTVGGVKPGWAEAYSVQIADGDQKVLNGAYT